MLIWTSCFMDNSAAAPISALGIIIYLSIKILVGAAAKLWVAMEHFQLPSALAAA